MVINKFCLIVLLVLLYEVGLCELFVDVLNFYFSYFILYGVVFDMSDEFKWNDEDDDGDSDNEIEVNV